MEFDELMLERAGKVGRVRADGFVRLAWIDEVDGSPQYARAYLPANYDPAKKWPHGHPDARLQPGEPGVLALVERGQPAWPRHRVRATTRA